MILFKLLGRAYKVLWSNTTGRPYTYIMREHPWIILSLFIVALASQIIWRYLWVMLPCDFVMILTGHVLWDTAGAYIKYQRDFRRGDG